MALNPLLPNDIRVRSAEEAPLDFHARYSARGKRYRYLVLRARTEDVFLRRVAAVISSPLDVEAMRRAGRALWGVHDFRAFEVNARRTPPELGAAPRSTVRTVGAVVVREGGNFLGIEALGKGFLYAMVRTIAGTLLEVGRGRLPPEAIGEVLRSKDRRRAGFTASPQGLSLLEVYYAEEEYRSNVAAAIASERGGWSPHEPASPQSLGPR